MKESPKQNMATHSQLMKAVRPSGGESAEILADAAPSFRRKGRLQVGADADITVFDPDSVAAQGDYLQLAPSTGFVHVIAGGVPVVGGGVLNVEAMPGRAVRGSRTTPSQVGVNPGEGN